MRFHDSPAIAASPVGDRVDHVVALVMGPPGTPYHCGNFLVELRFPPSYPNEPPRCRFLSSDNGRVRMNPNLYADGKICLSILGTWRGETTEIWRGSYSIAYVLQAIQCVIMNCDPFYNEPGFEREALLAPKRPPPPPASGADGEEGKKGRRHYTVKELDEAVQSYSDKIAHETMRVAVCDVLEALLDIKPPPSELAAPPVAAATSGGFSPPMPSTPSQMEGGGGGGGATESWVHESPEPQPQPPGDDTPPGLTPVTADPNATGFASRGTSPQSVVAHGARHPLLPHFLLFRNEILRQFEARFETHVEIARVMAPRLDGTYFVRQPFEFPNNACEGRFDFAHILARLENIRIAIIAETDAWRLKGRELTARMAYVASTLHEEAKTIDASGLCVSGGPVTSDNVFDWQFTIMAPEGLYEEGAYNVTATFHPDLTESPRVAFVQPIWHPNISPRGVPLYFMTDNDVPIGKRFLPTTIAAAIARLVERSPNVAPTSWVNTEAAKQCFSNDAEQQKEFKRKARNLAKRTVE